jgi:hypothetical protein
MSFWDIATLLGHAKLSTAQIYTRVSVGRMMQTYNAAHPQCAWSRGWEKRWQRSVAGISYSRVVVQFEIPTQIRGLWKQHDLDQRESGSMRRNLER